MLRTVFGVALALVLGAPAQAQTAVANVTIDTSKTGSVEDRDRHIYGQFSEHLGRGIYEGIWSGGNSKIPNIHGYRRDVVEALRKIHVPVIRWPGGCFADLYEPIGATASGRAPSGRGAHQRPLGRGDDGRQQLRHPCEFMNFAALIGADPYVS